MEFAKLKAIIAEVLDIDPDEINEDTSFSDDLGADSLDVAQIMMAVEDEFGIEFDPEDLADIVTVGDAAEKIKANVK